MKQKNIPICEAEVRPKEELNKDFWKKLGLRLPKWVKTTQFKFKALRKQGERIPRNEKETIMYEAEATNIYLYIYTHTRKGPNRVIGGIKINITLSPLIRVLSPRGSKDPYGITSSKQASNVGVVNG